jgi:hypothetical protein
VHTDFSHNRKLTALNDHLIPSLIEFASLRTHSSQGIVVRNPRNTLLRLPAHVFLFLGAVLAYHRTRRPRYQHGRYTPHHAVHLTFDAIKDHRELSFERAHRLRHNDDDTVHGRS